MAELDPRLYTVVWIAPLEIEARAALHLLDNLHQGGFPMTPGDNYVFQAGDACGHNVIIATLPAGEVYGTRSAAALATQVKKFFPNLWFGLLVGIAAGLPNFSRRPPLDIRLGDVLVGLPFGDNAGLIDYELGKETGRDGFQLLRAGHALAKTETVVRSAIGSIRLRAPNDSNDILHYYKKIEHKEHPSGTFVDPGQDRDMLYQVDECGIERLIVREQRQASKRIQVWYGSIGSGDKLMKNAQKRNELRDKYNIIGLEMEAAGTMDQIPVGVIRGVCDYGDEHKNDEWQPYAAAMAACYARAVLAEIRPNKAIQELPAKRKVDKGYFEPISNEERRKRQCHLEEREHPIIETTEDTVRQSLIEQLYFDKIDDRLINLPAAQSKTCCWFLTKPEYMSWNDVSQQQEHGGFLWIQGHPGTGKSTLMKFLFEKAKLKAKENSSQIILSFFFVARGTEEEKSTTGVYRSLLHQLFTQAPKTQDSLEWMTADGAKIIQRNGWHEKALKQTLALAVQKLVNRSLMVFVDALDECNKDQVADMVCFFEELCESAQESQVRLQICFSSRHYPTIVIEKGIQITLENEIGHTEDIEHYVKSKLRLGKSTQAASLRSEILNKSSGIFLWVVLVLDILNQEYPSSSISIKKIRDRLKEIPPRLNDLFEMILLRDSENLDRLHICLKWILFASRPLKPQELYFAVQFGHEKDCSGYWDHNDIELHEMKTFVRSSSKGLAEVTRNKASEVQFIHESVRDFLLKKYEMEWSENPRHFVGHSHKLLRDYCFTQLNNLIPEDIGILDPLPQASEPTQLRKTISSNYPFLDYSVSNVLHHANISQKNGIDQGEFLANFPLEKWRLFNNTLEQFQIRRYKKSVSFLYVLAEKNLSDLILIHPRRFSCFDVELEDERYGTPIFAALATDSREAVSTLLRLSAETVLQDSPIHRLLELYWQDRKKSTIFGRNFSFSRRKGTLFYLAEEDNEALNIAFFASAETDPNSKDSNGLTPLLWAVKRGHDTLVKLSLAKDATDPNCKDTMGQSALSWAAQQGHVPIVELLLAKDATDPNSTDILGRSALSWAAQQGHVPIVELLLAKDATDPNSTDTFGRSALSWAAQKGHVPIVELLLAKDATDPNSTDTFGRSALFRAAQQGHVLIVELLLAKGVEINHADFTGSTALLWAAKHGNVTLAELLLSTEGVHINHRDDSGFTALSFAAKNGSEAVIKLLLLSGSNCIYHLDKGSYCPLCCAAYNTHASVIKLLLENDLDCTDECYAEALCVALKKRHTSVAIILLETDRVNFNHLDSSSHTPLSLAADGGLDIIVKVLLTKGAVDLEHKTASGQTPLSLAAAGGHEAIVEMLLAKDSVNPNYEDERGETPLSLAAAGGHEAVVRMLLASNRVNPNYANRTGITPL